MISSSAIIIIIIITITMISISIISSIIIYELLSKTLPRS